MKITLSRLLCLCAVTALTSGTAIAQEMASAPGGKLRLLDKLTGRVLDVSLGVGQIATEGRLAVQMDECRFPKDNPASDAEAHLTILDTANQNPLFKGWMVASSPALSAMDHPRYDVWVLSCDSGFVAPEIEEVPTDEQAPPEEINEG